MEFTEKETLQDALIAHKFLINMYTQFSIECSNIELRNLFEENCSMTLEHNLKLFNIMNDKGFYPTTPATVKDIKNTITMHKQMQTELEDKLS